MSSAQQLKEYERLFNIAQGYDPAKFASEFEKAYGEATNYNKDLIEDRSAAIGQMQALPGQLREQYYSSPIRNPLAQEALIGTRKGNISSNIGTLTDLLTARRARYEDVLAKQLAAYEAAAQRAQMAAENQWRLYQDALAREQAARASRQTGPSAEDILNLLQGGTTPGPTGPGQGNEELVIQTPDNVGGFLDKVFRVAGADYSVPATSTKDKVLKGLQVFNPVTWVKTGAGMLGNYIGNKNQEDKNLFQKLLNR